MKTFIQFVEPCDDGLCSWGQTRLLEDQMKEVQEDVTTALAKGLDQGYVAFRGFHIHWRIAQ